MKNIHSVQNELFLKQQSLLIIKSMQEFNQNDEYFEYPRFKTFESGLYDKNFKPIFSLIKGNLSNFKEGYYLDESDAYLITKLPKGRYFSADYLIIKNRVSFAVVYEKVVLILFSVVIFILMLSIFFLNRFALPFKRINEQLDNFIKDSIHEINTPLSIINVNIDLYNRKNPQNKYMQRMKAAAKVLSNIYNDMDYLVKHDRVEYEREQINLSNFLKERIEYFSEVALMKNINIVSEIADSIIILMNPKQLRRVVDNNISNAIKYSYEENSIRVSLDLKAGFCYLSFKDSGVGIENVDQIFKRYYREDTLQGGFGIGLNIVSSIIKEYEIKLEIQSELKKGTTFTYIFPQKMLLL
jgi:two-component system, OmpR family, sensor kinase